MDVATRFQSRVRAPSFLDRERNNMPDDSEAESESLTRRKFQRTEVPATDSSGQFRKPALPASATRPNAVNHQRQNSSTTDLSSLQRRPSLTNAHKRRTSGVTRENMRVPSGPREYPGSPGKRNVSSNYIPNAPAADSINARRRPSYLPSAASEPHFASSITPIPQSEPMRGWFGDPNESSEPTTPASQRARGDSGSSLSFDFVPAVNFDEFQTRLASLDSGPNLRNEMMNDSPAMEGGRAFKNEEDRDLRAITLGNGFSSKEKGDGDTRKATLSRAESFRKRLGGLSSRQPSNTTPQKKPDASPAKGRGPLALRTKRQSTAPEFNAVQPNSISRPPQRPTDTISASGFSTTNAPKMSFRIPTGFDEQSKSNITRSASLAKAQRTGYRSHGGVQANTDTSRISTLAVANPNRQAKGKSLQPPPRDADPYTPTGKPGSKGSTGGNTPGSSGNNRRQSVVSGRVSGLGARTISPTDARRLKRISMAAQPPLPSNFSNKGPPTPGEETVSAPPSHPQHNQSQFSAKFAELPRLVPAPSPSLIPTRTTTSSLASHSARASPIDAASINSKYGFPFPNANAVAGTGRLSSRSSFASLHTASSGGALSSTQSRVPVPKARNVHSSGGGSPYGDESMGQEEVIPPVPAIPKDYESPRETNAHFFGNYSRPTTTRKGSATTIPGNFDESILDNDGSWLGVPYGESGRSSFEIDKTRPNHKRRSTLGNPGTIASPSVATPRTPGPAVVKESVASAAGFTQTRRLPDPNGRMNSNLQPLRLPPLNLLPISTSSSSSSSGPRNDTAGHFPRPSQEVDDRDRDMWELGAHTPNNFRRGQKTPSTPMTASKATFFRRAKDVEPKNAYGMRSSTSHYALRSNVGFDAEAMRTGWLEDSDDASGNGVPIPTTNGQNYSRMMGSRAAITPFASGSLPKHSGEFGRLRPRPSGEFHDDAFFLGNAAGHYDGLQLAGAKPQGPRPRVSESISRPTLTENRQNPGDADNRSPLLDMPQNPTEKDPGSGKKEPGGLRRKLSLGWRRTSSKAANHGDNAKMSDSEHRKLTKDAPHRDEMAPPRLPSNAAWTADGSLGFSNGGRPSLDSGELTSMPDRMRRKTSAAALVTSTEEDNMNQEPKTGQSAAIPHANGAQPAVPKTRALHSERPQPVSGLRSSSWGSFARNSVVPQKPVTANPRLGRHQHTASSISALVKDNDDIAADDEMRKLSQKRKDVDSAARVTEDLTRRAIPRESLTLEQALHDRHGSLNIFERGEVIEYENEGIFFTGTKHAKKIIGSLSQSPLPSESTVGDKNSKSGNHGYDDERGDYNIVLGDHLAYRYEVVDILGKGSFGQVVRCVDHKEGGVVAVKIIRNKKRFHQQALVEVGILGKLREWDPEGTHATLSITGSFYFRSHLCIVTPCLSINLYELIRAHNFTGFSLPLIRRFSRQLLACLVLLQQKRIIHCDLKPENILLCSARAADVRVIDFGSSCREEEKVYTYIQSRFYRSPEVILGSSYGLGIDMWSFGCILAELWTGYPIFPGENEQEQLACIMEIFGPPDRHLVERCTRKKLFFDSMGKPRITVSSKGRRRRPSSKTLQQALKSEDEAFLDFISRCLRWDPERRLKPHEACSHPFIMNQPLNQRPGIPDEARRAARVRSAAAAAITGTSTSPVKRTLPQQAVTATPQKAISGSRQLPETPQTALRAPPSTTHNPWQASPVKASTARRQSNIAFAGGAAAVAGSKRASNGAVLAAGLGGPGQKTGIGSLAERAARESMAATAATNGTSGSASGRWRI